MIPICRDPKRFVASLVKGRPPLCTILTGPSGSKKNGTYAAANFVKFQSNGASKCSNPPQSSVNLLPFSRSLSTAMKVEEVPVYRKEIGVISRVYQSEREPVKTTLNLVGPRDAAWFTGKMPIPSVCPGVDQHGKIRSLAQVTANPVTGKYEKKALQDYFDNTWTMTEVLLSSLQGEEAFTRSPYHDLRHPMIFYYGHPAALYVNKLRVAGLVKESINPYYEAIFETGVDEMSWDDLSKNKMPWPSVSEVHQYRRKVYQTVSNAIANLKDEDLSVANQTTSPVWSLLMGFEHERIHLETSSFLINELPIRFVRFPEGMPQYYPSTKLAATSSHSANFQSPQPGKDYPVNNMITVDATKVSIGKNRDFPSYGWDNEYGYREFELPSFRASQYLISNGEFYEFVKDFGYSKSEFWTEVGWKWRAFRNVKWPTFWLRKGPQGHHEYDLRLVFDEVSMQWDWPVTINYHEAVAFAKWKSAKDGKKYRIMTELEHRAIRDPEYESQRNQSAEKDYAAAFDGHSIAKAGLNANLAYSSQSPVNALKPNSKGFHDVFGNAWQWTEDYFCPLPGFNVHPYYEDFSTPCFDGLHQVIMGGSFISTGNEASVHARFHFRPHFYQHASFRLVEVLSEDPTVQCITSDLDAPGPYVGNYPFRRSSAKLLEEAKRSNEGGHGATSLKQKYFQHHLGVQWSNFFLNQAQPQQGKVMVSAVRGKKGEEVAVPSPMFGLAQTILSHLSSSISVGDGKKCIEVGCGFGGLSFLLAPHFQTFIGIDHDMEVINILRRMSSASPSSGDAVQTFSLLGEGEEEEPVSLRLTAPAQGQMEFRCSDPMCLPAEMHSFDTVIVNDVLDRMTSPNAILGRLGGIRGLLKANNGSKLFVLSAYQWQENTTPKSLWLGGYHSNTSEGRELVSSEQVLIQRLKEMDIDHEKSYQVPIVYHDTKNTIKGKVLTLSVFTRK